MPIEPKTAHVGIVIKTALIFVNTFICTLLNLPWHIFGRKAPDFVTLLWHRTSLKILGLKVIVSGQRLPNGAAGIFCSNHLSYLDIAVLGSVIAGRFVSRGDVKDWPFFGYLAKRQNTIFIDRKRHNTGKHAHQLTQEFCKNIPVILFAEGTSGAGIEVGTIKSSLLAPLGSAPELPVQPVTIHYKMRYDIPMGRAFEPLCAWYGDMALLPHLKEFLSMGPVTAHVVFHPPVCLEEFHGERKLLAKHIHRRIASGLQHLRRSKQISL